MVVADFHGRTVAAGRADVDAAGRRLTIVDAGVELEGINNPLGIFRIQIYALLEGGLGGVDRSAQPPEGVSEIARCLLRQAVHKYRLVPIAGHASAAVRRRDRRWP